MANFLLANNEVIGRGKPKGLCETFQQGYARN